jgi:predicted nucleic acid-binding protein
MAILLDTSILCRLANPGDTAHQSALDAIAKLQGLGEVLHLTAQNLIEFRSVATREVSKNGLGLSPADATRQIELYESTFSMLPENPDIYPAWRALVDGLGVIGKTVHDARLVAVCHVHGVPQILTFNVSQFATLAKFGPGVAVLDPRSI